MGSNESEMEQEIGTNNAISSANPECSKAALEEYWLNEIESQEDTARQIMSISILLLGVSITLITNNIDNIDFLLNQTYSQIKASTSNDLLNSLIFYIMVALTVAFFFIYIVIWIMAIIRSRESLKIEPISNKSLPEIAEAKQRHCESATNIIVLGIAITATLTVFFLIIILNYDSLDAIAIAVTILICVFIFKIYSRKF